MGGEGRRTGTALALALLAAAGCGSPKLDPLPEAPTAPGDAAATPAAEGEVSEAPFVPPADALVSSVEGDLVLPGVVLSAPRFDAATATATFALRNAGSKDLPDLILNVVFAIRAGDESAPLRPRMETVEAPLRKGESREFRVSAAAARTGERAESFRVTAGLPEVLSAREDDAPGTSFLGGLLECVALDVDLTADLPRVTVDLADRGETPDGAPLPRLECQLLLGRHGRLVWTGPWILVPSPDPENGGVRRIRWSLHGAPGVAGSVLFLRVRERR